MVMPILAGCALGSYYAYEEMKLLDKLVADPVENPPK